MAGTLILTAGGEKFIENIEIEDIDVGDTVWAKDQTTGAGTLRVVDKTYIRYVTELYELTIDGDVIMTTAEHPFWVDGRGWDDVGELMVGDVFVTPQGTAAVEKIAVAEVFEDDESGQRTVSLFEDDVPLRAIEWLLTEARRRL